jgi:hypothetical protein
VGFEKVAAEFVRPFQIVVVEGYPSARPSTPDIAEHLQATTEFQERGV